MSIRVEITSGYELPLRWLAVLRFEKIDNR
jgi:hypothetical protein